MRIKANHFAKIIREKRQLLKLSQVAAEQKIFLTEMKKGQYWSNIERGMCTMPLKHLSNAALVLEIPINELIEAYILDYREAVLSEVNHEH